MAEIKYQYAYVNDGDKLISINEITSVTGTGS